jgi:Leucine-rich repeat (LRR) protein
MTKILSPRKHGVWRTGAGTEAEMRFSLQSRTSSERRSSRQGTRACFLAVALLLLGAPLVQAALSTAEHNALADLYNSTNGASWSNKTNWLVAADECTWYGISCDAGHTTVQVINLPNNNLSGTLPASLGNLTSLQQLYLRNSQLTGSIPTQLGSLTGLHAIDLFNNQLSGSIPAQLGSLTSLQTLVLSSNQLSGSIPAQLGSLTSLQTLELSSNQLSGSIPAQLGSLTSLHFLVLRSNQLSGSIPAQLGSLTSLVQLDLAANQLSGSIPAQLGSLTSLVQLYLFNNQLSGSIPPELGSLTSLQYFALTYNQLSGSIPAQLGSLTTLKQLDLSDNQLSGSIPPQLGNLTSLQYLLLDHNQLSGSIPPELGSLTSLQYLYLSFNQLSGSIPAQLGNLTGLNQLNLWGNQLSGSIPPVLTNLTNLTPGNSDLRWNALYSTDPALTSFLNAKQGGGDWQSTQTIAPANVSTSGATLSAITVSWTPIAYTADNGFYQVWYSTTAGGPYTPFATTTSSKSSSSLSVTGLSPNTTYYFVVSTTTPPHGININTVTSGFSTEVSGLTTPTAVSTFTASPATITAGQSSNLIWTTTNTASVSISGVAGTQPANGSVSVSPTTTTTYTLTATGPGGTATATTTITVNPAPPPIVGSFAASPSTITAGQSSTLSWTTTNTTSVSISGVTGTQPANGSASVSPTTTTTYTLTATGAGGTATATTTITVNPAPPIVGSFAASPPTIAAGQSSTLSWTTTNTASLSISGVGTQAVSGSVSVSPTTTTTYTLTATGPGGTATASTTVTVTSAPPTVTSFTASPATITAGQSSTLSWTTTNTASVSISGVGTQPVSGSVSVSPTTTTTYTLTATGPGGTATATTTITVNPAPPPIVGSFAASPATIIPGQSSTLSWTTTNTSSVAIGGLGSQPVNGSVSVSPATTTTYTLTATGPGGTATATTTITVNPAPPIVVSFAASPATITAGQSSTLSWTTTNTTSVAISGVGAQPVSGSVSVSPTTTTTYTLSATGPGGTATAETTVTVFAAFNRLQLLLPGEIAVPGAPTGKVGSPATQVAGVPFTVIVNGVDSSFNLMTAATDTVRLTGSDAEATLPPNAPLVGGTRSFTVTLRARKSQTITASDVTDPSKSPSTSPPFAVIAVNDAAVAVATFPSGMVTPTGTAVANDSYVLINTGGTPTTITLTQSGTFFTQSPASFTLQPGRTQRIALHSIAQPAGIYEGVSIPSGDGVPEGMIVPVRLLSADSPAGAVRAAPTESRADVSADLGTNPTGTVEFTNSGSATLQGILVSDSPWLIPQPDVITIPPGQTVTVTFRIDRSNRPDGGAVGSIAGKLSLVFLAGTGPSALPGRVTPNDNTPQTGQTSVSVVDVARPPAAQGTIPPLGFGEVALLVSGLRHGNGVKADLAFVNTGLPASLNDLKLYYVSPSAASLGSAIGQLQPSISVSLADVVKNVFGRDGETGGVLLRSTKIDLVSLSAMRLNTSSPRGTYASSLPVFRSDRSMAAGSTVFLAGLKKENGFHTNVCLQEAAGMAGSVKIDFLDAHGTPIGTRAPDALPPFGFLEIADAAPAGAAAARITSLGPSQSRIVAYGLAIDEVTGDSWGLVDWSTLYAAPATDPSVLPLPGGGSGARAQTDLALVNKTPAVNLVTLKYTTSGSSRRHAARPNGFSMGSPATPEALIEQTRTIALDPLSSTTISDLLSTRFAVPSDSIGYLTITPAAGVAITARTYTSSAQPGTAGTGVAAIPVSSTLTAGQAKYFAGIEDASPTSITANAPATYRTNLGIIETAGQPVSVRVTMRYSFPAGLLLSGHAESAKDFVLSPGQFLLVTDAATAIIGDARSSFGDLHNVQIEIQVTDGNGRVLPFLQSIDNGTGDVILRTD